MADLDVLCSRLKQLHVKSMEEVSGHQPKGTKRKTVSTNTAKVNYPHLR